MAGRADIITDCLRELSIERLGHDLPYLTALAWNVRHVRGSLLGQDGPLENVLRIYNPRIIVLTEVSRGAFVRGEMEPSPNLPYRFVTLSSGGDQRTVIGYDVRYARLKGRVAAVNGDFTRAPLYAHFALIYPERPDPIDLQVVAVHLKSKRGDHEAQRLIEVDALGDWISKVADAVDADMLVLGDLNSPAFDDDLERFRVFEQEGMMAFERLNRNNEIAAILRRVRVRPTPSNIKGACFLELSLALRSSVGATAEMSRKKDEFDRAVAEVLKNEPEGAYARWLESTPCVEPDLMPNLFAFYFQEFEPNFSFRAV